MRIMPAEIDHNGVKTILRFAADPARIQATDEPPITYPVRSQRYIPGISVPEVADLQQPFNVPIIGDNESMSLVIDWPNKDESRNRRRVSFIGMLVAEDMYSGVPLNREREAHEYEDLKVARTASDALYDYTGEWGGFLCVVVEQSAVKFGGQHVDVNYGTAEFLVAESQTEYRTLHDILDKDLAGPAELVGAIRLSHLVRTLGAEALIS